MPGAVPGRCSACGLAGRHRSRRALREARRAEPAGSRSLRGGGVSEPSGARGAAPTLVTAPTPFGGLRVAAAAPAAPREAWGIISLP